MRWAGLMPRIRSIKPEFFTSETIAKLPVSARLTFVGLWTHVDDNGVCVANELLIAAALCPLDGPEGIERTREDLRRLTRESLIQVYGHAGKRYMYIRSWDEHQKVSHPSKARYPRPDEVEPPPPTSPNGHHKNTTRQPSGESPEGLASPSALSREQGAGSREQGKAADAAAPITQQEATVLALPIKVDAEQLPAMPEIPPASNKPLTVNQRAKRLADAYYEIEPVSNWNGVRGVVVKFLSDPKNRWSDDQIGQALGRLADSDQIVTVGSVKVELKNGEGLPSNGKPNPLDERKAMLRRQMDRAQAKQAAREAAGQ